MQKQALFGNRSTVAAITQLVVQSVMAWWHTGEVGALQYLEFPVKPVPLEIHNSEAVVSQQCEQDDNGPVEMCAAGQNAVHSVRDMADYSAWCRGV